MYPLLTLPLCSKRDVLHARHWARRVASLFHCPLQEQSCIAAGVFAVASQALRRFKSAELGFKVQEGKLHVFPVVRDEKDLLCLIKPLPAAAGEFTAEDLGWMLAQLNQQAPFNLFDEMEHQNQEMLALLHDLQSAQAELQNLKEKTASSNAA